MTQTTYRKAVELLEAEVNEEIVALEPNKGNCFGFNLVATAVWRKLEQPRSFDELRKELLRDYDVSREQCTSELQDLLQAMQNEGLIKTA